MENAANIPSEEELLKLRNEGAITENEYKDLYNAMKTRPVGSEEFSTVNEKTNSRCKPGKSAFLLMLTGIILPIMSFFIAMLLTGFGEGDVIFKSCFVLCLLLEISALVLGATAWRDNLGRTAAIASGIIIVLAVLLVA